MSLCIAKCIIVLVPTNNVFKLQQNNQHCYSFQKLVMCKNKKRLFILLFVFCPIMLKSTENIQFCPLAF